MTEEQAYSCWKVPFGGQERLVLAEALVLEQADDLCLYWREQSSTSLAIYPPLAEDVIGSQGTIARAGAGCFTCYTPAMPERVVELDVEQLCGETLRIKVPAALPDGAHDIFLRIDYFGDVGHAYLDGRLVSDHFANGSPWEIGLKRFMLPAMERELVVHLSPFQQDAAQLRYFTGKSMPPARDDGVIPVEVYGIAVIAEYHETISLSFFAALRILRG